MMKITKQYSRLNLETDVTQCTSNFVDKLCFKKVKKIIFCLAECEINKILQRRGEINNLSG